MIKITSAIIIVSALAFLVFCFAYPLERVVPTKYVGPDVDGKRESFIIACLSATDPSLDFKNKEDVISLCHAVSVTLYGVQGFVYKNRSGEEISMIKPCIKAGSPKERKVCGK